MNRSTKLLNKICAILILFAICISDFLFVGTKLVSYAIDNVKTNIYNVDFLAYFVDENGEKVDKIQKEIDDEKGYLYVDIDVKNEGYFNGTIDLENSNFDLVNEDKIDEVSEISGNKVTLKQINAGNSVTIKFPIKAKIESQIKEEDLHKKTKVVLSGEYVNSKNAEKQNYTNVNGETDVEVDWKSSKTTQAELNAKVLTNSTYIIENKEKQIVQILIGSKISNNNYPVKDSEINLNVLPNVEDIEVHTRSTDATNGNIKFGKSNYIYNNETNNLKIYLSNDNINEVSWNKNSIDLFVVTYVFSKDENLLNKEISIENKIDTFDEKQFTARKNVVLNEKKDGIISYSIKNSEESIYKGNLYIGEPREYKENARINIDYVGIAENISLNSNEDVYLDDINEKMGNILYKQSKINKEEFTKIFGEEGFITVKDNQGTVIANINNKTAPDEQGNYVLEYTNNTKNIQIITSKPINVGTLNIENSKAILNNKYNREEVKSFTSIKSNFIGSYNEKKNETIEKQIELKDTITKAKIEVNTKKLTTEKTNENVKIKVVLPNNSENLDVLSNPDIKITFPKQITNITAKCKVLYGNGLVLGDTSIQNEDGNNTINIKLNGVQNTYNPLTIDGTTIAIYTNIDVDKNVSTSIEDIILNYTNEFACILENNGEQRAQVKIIEAPKQEEPVAKQEPELQQEPKQDTKEENKVTKQETKELNGINMTTSATVGGEMLQDGDEVKAGEIIAYNIKLENKTEEDIEGLDLTATIPENTTLIEVNPKYESFNDTTGEETNAHPYMIEKTNKVLTQEGIKIESNKINNLSYMVRVNDDIVENKEEENSVIIKYKNDEMSSVFKHTFTANSLITILEPLNREPFTELKSNYAYMYALEIKNNSKETAKNVEIVFNKNDLIDILSVTYSSKEGDSELTGNNLTYTIDSIPAKTTGYVIIRTFIQKTNDQISNAEISATVKSNSNTFKTNKLSESVSSVKMQIKSSVETTGGKEVLSTDDKIKYIFEIKNTGSADATDVEIKDNFSQFLNIESVSINGEIYEYLMDIGEDNNNVVRIVKPINNGEEIVLEVVGNVAQGIDVNKQYDVLNRLSVYNEGILLAETDEIKHKIEIKEKEKGEEQTEEKEKQESEEENQGPRGEEQAEGSEDKNTQDENSNIEDIKKHNDENEKQDTNDEDVNVTSNNISGTAWLDENKNGERESQEELLENIDVTLLNLDTNKTQQTSTNENGAYEFKNIENGRYIVIFEYDNEIYSLTTYQADGVSSLQNSDVELVEMTQNGEKQKVASTDTLTLNNENIENIDIGLVEASVFDLSLTKTVSKITISNSQGTTVQEFKDNSLAKAEIKAKYLKGTTVIIEYKISVTNNGEIAGYATSIVDYKPTDLNFNSSLNKDWTQSGNELYNESLEDTLIKAGETKEIKLVLTKQMTESNTGLINNIAEIKSADNDIGVDDVNSTPGNKNSKENDQGQANVIISVSTGVAFKFAFITLFTIILIATAGYVISKKILERNINF